MSMYKNKGSFCRHAPGHADPLRLFFSTHFVEVMVPRCSNKNLYKMSLWKNIYEISPSSIQKWSLQNERTQAHFFGQNPARHKMMVYAGHVPTHFMPEISRGM